MTLPNGDQFDGDRPSQYTIERRIENIGHAIRGGRTGRANRRRRVVGIVILLAMIVPLIAGFVAQIRSH